MTSKKPKMGRPGLSRRGRAPVASFCLDDALKLALTAAVKITGQRRSTLIRACIVAALPGIVAKSRLQAMAEAKAEEKHAAAELRAAKRKVAKSKKRKRVAA